MEKRERRVALVQVGKLACQDHLDLRAHKDNEDQLGQVDRQVKEECQVNLVQMVRRDHKDRVANRDLKDSKEFKDLKD